MVGVMREGFKLIAFELVNQYIVMFEAEGHMGGEKMA